MACNRCGHTKSSPCACHDHGLTTPCSYTNCDTPACEEVICSECIVDCSNSHNRSTGSVTWEAERSAGATSAPGDGIAVKQSASSTELLQRLALATTDPAGGDAMAVAIAPFSVNNVTSTSVNLAWSNVPSTVNSVTIYKAPIASSTWTIHRTISSKLGTTLSEVVDGLTTRTAYKFKLVSSAPGGEGRANINANSVALYVTTK